MSAIAAPGIPPAGSKGLAAIMSKNEKWPFNAADDGWVMIHNALRADMLDISTALERLAAQAKAGQKLAAWEVKHLQAFYRLFHKEVHQHHDHEEELVFPWLSTRVQMPPKLTADHKTLVQMLDDCLAGVMELRAGEVQAAELAVLRDVFAKMRREMEEHLAEEEEVGLPLMRMHFSFKEFAPVEKKILEKVGTPQGLAHFLRTCTREEKITWMTNVGHIPGLAQHLVLLPASRRFDRDFLSKIDCVKRGEPPAPKRGLFTWFSP